MAQHVELGTLPASERRPVVPRRILSLSGGGFRGLFTARVLELMEAQAGCPLRERFDLIGGTSIGGILAIGLACGVAAEKLRLEIEARGKLIFHPRLLSLGGFLGTKYDPRPLGDAIEAMLGPMAWARFGDLPAPVLVVAIDQATAAPRIFRSNKLVPGAGDTISVLDAALATSAAPTYFPAHPAERTTYVDGGLIANAPDLVLMVEALRRFAVGLDALNVCAVGTAASPRVGTATGALGRIGWIVRHDLVSLTIDAQARLAADQLAGLLSIGVLRIDGRPRHPIALDDASPTTAQILRDLADEAMARTLSEHGPEFRQMLARRT